jgi:hypothetical protein
MREILMAHKEIISQLGQQEQKLIDHDNKILLIFEYIKQLEQLKKDEVDFKERKRIGFVRNNES